jgi:hypothetical protein
MRKKRRTCGLPWGYGKETISQHKNAAGLSMAEDEGFSTGHVKHEKTSEWQTGSGVQNV